MVDAEPEPYYKS